MKMMAVVVSMFLVGTLAWWGYDSVGGAQSAETIESFAAKRRGFKITLQEKGELQAAASIDVKCELEGRSTILWLIDEGKRVEKGEVLVELASDEIAERLQSQRIEVATAKSVMDAARVQLDILRDQNQSNVDKAALKLELAELDLKKYLEGDWLQQKENADMRLEEAVVKLEREARKLENSVVLREKDYISQTDLEDAKLRAMQAEMEYTKATRDLRLLEEITHKKDVKQKTSDVEEARKELARVEKESGAKETQQIALVDARDKEYALKKQRLEKYERQIKNSKIHAPSAGMVVYGSSQGGGRHFGGDEIKEGAQVRERQTILELPDTSKMKVVVRIHEARTDKISEGLPAKIEIEGIKDREFTGHIAKIAPLADSQNRWLNPELKEYETEIVLDQNDDRLKPGATAHVEIMIGELEDVVAVPIQSVYRRGPKSFVFVGNTSETAEPVEVQIGLANEFFVEVKDGIKENDRVLLAVSDDLKRELPQVPTGRFGKPSQDTAQQAPGATGQKATGKSKGHGGRKPGGKSGGKRRSSHG